MKPDTNIEYPSKKEVKTFLSKTLKRLEYFYLKILESKSSQKSDTIDSINNIKSLRLPTTVETELLAKLDEELDDRNKKYTFLKN